MAKSFPQKNTQPETPVAPAVASPAFKVILGGPLELPDLMQAAAADGWRVAAIVAMRGTNEHAAYLSR